MQTFTNEQREQKTTANEPAACGSEILSGYMSSRIISSKFLTVNTASKSETNGVKLPTKNQITEDNIGGGQINSKNCSEIETSYPVPPPIKKNERPRLIINLGMQKVRAQKRDFSILNHTGEKSKNECNMDSFEMEGKGNSTLNTAQKTTVI